MSSARLRFPACFPQGTYSMSMTWWTLFPWKRKEWRKESDSIWKPVCLRRKSRCAAAEHRTYGTPAGQRKTGFPAVPSGPAASAECPTGGETGRTGTGPKENRQCAARPI